jgi:hypothetical protein
MFNRSGDRAMGSPIYVTCPAAIRQSLFCDNWPRISVVAYASKNDTFTGLRIEGNTFIHGGAVITSTGRASIIRNNVIHGSRAISSAGSDVVIEGNLAVYDPLDLAQFPRTVRRDVGFRLYGTNAALRNNTFVGFDEGGNVYAPKDATPSVVVEGNRWFGYTRYALRIFTTQGLTCDGNQFSPAGQTEDVVYYTPTADDKTLLGLAQWRERGFGKTSRADPAAVVVLPRVLQEAQTHVPSVW